MKIKLLSEGAKVPTRAESGAARRNGAGKRLLGRTATGSILTYLIYGRNRMNDKKIV